MSFSPNGAMRRNGVSCALVSVGEMGHRKLMLNLNNVEYLASTALPQFIALNNKVKAAGGRLVLVNIDPQVSEVFEITKLNKLFRIFPTRAEALASFTPA